MGIPVRWEIKTMPGSILCLGPLDPSKAMAVSLPERVIFKRFFKAPTPPLWAEPLTHSTLRRLKYVARISPSLLCETIMESLS